MTSGQLIEKCKQLCPQCLSDSALLSLLDDCEKKVYAVCGCVKVLSLSCENYTVMLPQGVTPDLVVALSLPTGQRLAYQVGKDRLCTELGSGQVQLVHRLVPDKIEFESVLFAGEMYSDVYLYYLLKMSMLMAGDTVSFNNFNALYQEAVSQLKQLRFGSTPYSKFAEV